VQRGFKNYPHQAQGNHHQYQWQLSFPAKLCPVGMIMPVFSPIRVNLWRDQAIAQGKHAIANGWLIHSFRVIRHGQFSRTKIDRGLLHPRHFLQGGRNFCGTTGAVHAAHMQVLSFQRWGLSHQEPQECYFAILMLVKCIRVGAIRQFALRSVPHQIDNCYKNATLLSTSLRQISKYLNIYSYLER